MLEAPAAPNVVEAAAAYSLVPLWTLYHDLVPLEPAPACQPMLWRYRDVRPLLHRAGQEVSTDQAERRVLLFKNPGLQRPFTTHTLGCGLQMIKQGEVEGAHRHTPAALRLVVEGDGAYTVTDGERIWMNPGDVITTPSWTWHDHAKVTEGEMVWLDGIDVPLTTFLHVGFAAYADGSQPQPLTRQDSDSHYRYGGGLQPLHGLPTHPYSPVFAYPYERTREILEHMRKGQAWDPWHAVKLKFANPLNGDHFMPTIAGFMQLLPAGFRSRPYRSTDATVFSVVEGTGSFTVGQQVWGWEKGDVFVAPNWTFYSLEASEDAVVFSYSDRAMQERLGFWREERADA